MDYETTSKYELTITISDPDGLTAVQVVTINVLDVNEAPYVTSSDHDVDVSEDEVNNIIVMNVDASDPDSDVLDYQITNEDPSGAPFIIDTSTGIAFNNQIIYFFERSQQVPLWGRCGSGLRPDFFF